MISKRAFGFGATVAVCCLQAFPSAAAHAANLTRLHAPIDETQRVALGGGLHPALRESRDLGPAAAGRRAGKVILLLTGSASQEADLAQFLRAVQTPGNPAYRRWLTPEAFGARFGVAAADRTVIATWLTHKGFRVDAHAAGGRAITFSGSFGQLDAAFGTAMHRYAWHGEVHVANSRIPTVPRALAGVVAGFASLSDFRLRSQLVRAKLNPQLTATNGEHYLAPGDFAIIYDLDSLYARGINGTGRSIAVLGQSDVVSGDLSTFREEFGLSATLPQTILAGTDPGLVSGDELESDLDLEWAAGIAPSATVYFVTSATEALTDGVILSAQYAVDNNLADVITISYAGCESTSDIGGGTTLFNQLWQQAAAQGTSVFVASGDSGAAGCDSSTAKTATHGLGVNAVCTSPFSTCVGGTEFSADLSNPGEYWSGANSAGTQASALSYIGEDVWNQSAADGGADLAASGGGASIYVAKPAWQLAVGVPSDAHRDVPDIALSASSAHDAYVVYTSQGYPSSTLIGIGGTSAPTPSMAGLAALVAQSQNGRVGSFNPTLYGLSGLQASGGANVLHRITVGNNSVPGQTGFAASATDPDYNEASGLGSIDGALLVANWNAVGAPAHGLSPGTAVLPAAASIGGAMLSLPAATAWTATVGTAAAGWLAVTPTSGTGSAPLTYSASANTSTSARSGTISVDGQVLSVTQAAAAGGAGTGVLSLSTATINFGGDTVGSTSGPAQLLLENTGNANLTLGSITLGGSASAAFAESGSCAADVVLIPGAVCYLEVSFDPATVGADSADLQIDIGSQDAGNVALSGAGVAASTNDTDGPLPPWAYAALATLLTGIAQRKRRGTRLR